MCFSSKYRISLISLMMLLLGPAEHLPRPKAVLQVNLSLCLVSAAALKQRLLCRGYVSMGLELTHPLPGLASSLPVPSCGASPRFSYCPSGKALVSVWHIGPQVQPDRRSRWRVGAGEGDEKSPPSRSRLEKARTTWPSILVFVCLFVYYLICILICIYIHTTAVTASFSHG